MSKRLIGVVSAALTACSLVTPGCGDDETSGNNRPNPVAVIAAATDMAVLSGVSLQAALLGTLAFPPVTPLSPAPADTLFPPPLICPTVQTWSDSTGADTLSLDYGAGCPSVLDGQTVSGTVLLDVGSNTLGNGYRFLTNFQDYSRNERMITGGTMSAEERGFFVDVTAVDLILTGVAVGGTLDASFTAEGPMGSGDPFYCRDWTIASGSGTMTIGNTDYAVEVLEPLVIDTCCPYPREGLLSITVSGLTPAFFDYGTGVCDSLATLTIGGDTQTIVMGY